MKTSKTNKNSKNIPWRFNLNVETLENCLNQTFNSGTEQWLCEIKNDTSVSHLSAFNKSKIKSFDKDILLDYLFYLGYKVTLLNKIDKTFIVVNYKCKY